MAGYTQGTFFTVTPIETDTNDQWGEIKALNEQAISSVMLGFTFDTTEVNDQLANCREIWLRYRSEVMTGVKDPAEVVPQIKEELMQAGWQEVMDAAQTQVDEFLAAKQK
jgi:putative aldouronate transport system substrate-binding protein